MSPHFFAHIIHILESDQIITDYIQSSEEGLDDPKTYEAVLYRIQTLSESAHKLPDDIKQEYPSVKWQYFSQTRNAVVHDYLGDTSPKQIFDFIHEHLPILRLAMEKQLPEWKDLRARLTSDEE